MKNLWLYIKEEAKKEKCTFTFPLVTAYILSKQSLVDAIATILASKLKDSFINQPKLDAILSELAANDTNYRDAFESDLIAAFKQDFASKFYHEVLLFSRGYLALQAYRLAHRAYYLGHRTFSLWLKDRVTEIFNVDIHPACKIGKRVVLDHAHGLVIGETAKIGNDVTLFHNVTIGSTGKQNGQRHPTIKDNVIIGTGATLIGNITISHSIRANELVLKHY